MSAPGEISDATALCVTAGMTYRQLDHWTRKGYVRAEGQGSGVWRLFSDEEVAVATLMVQLVDAGMVVAVAAVIARQAATTNAHAGNIYRLTSKVAVRLDPRPVKSAILKRTPQPPRKGTS